MHGSLGSRVSFKDAHGVGLSRQSGVRTARKPLETNMLRAERTGELENHRWVLITFEKNV